jgi:LmbE family N-acetylglucosaminyl deacetylase
VIARRRIVVLSPHLDDGVFSLGGSIAQATRRGAQVHVVTVFANDPQSDRPASPFDAGCGFRTESEAAAARREEDRRACEFVGAEPVWLTCRDEEYGGEQPDDVWAALSETIEHADTVVCPGFPLYHPDHVSLTTLVAARLDRSVRLGLYVEQPYASWRLIGRGRRTWTMPGLTLRRGVMNLARILARTPEGRRLQRPALPPNVVSGVGGVTWTVSGFGPPDWLAKQRAVQAYASQLRTFGPLVGTRMALYEFAWGGEGLGWIRR